MTLSTLTRARARIGDEARFIVERGHRAVWVNGEDACIGRFGTMGIDIHNTLAAQEAGAGECLECTHTPTTLGDWERFKAGMMEHHGVDISDEPAPAWLLDRAIATLGDDNAR